MTQMVMEGKISRRAFWLLIAVMVAGERFVITGELLEVPAAAVEKIYMKRGEAYYRKTRLFQLGAVDESRGVDALLAEEGLPDTPETRARKDAVPHVVPAPAAPVAELKVPEVKAPAVRPPVVVPPTRPPPPIEAP